MDLITKFSESLDRNVSKTTDENIRALGEAIKKARDEGFPVLRTPIIAGGAVRDLVYGLEPNDYDVFLDVSRIPVDEQEDAVLLFGLRVIEELSKEGSKYMALQDTTLRQLGENNPYDRPENAIDPRWKNFYVFEAVDNDPAIVDLWGRTANERGIDIANDLFRFIKIQFIGHNDSRLSEENPLSFVEYFDYELVRGLYDPETKDYALHHDFLRVANSKEMETNNRRTYDRINTFIGRMRFFPTSPTFKITLKAEAGKFSLINGQSNPCSEILLPN